MSGLTFVAFTPRGEGFTAAVPLEQLDGLGAHPELLLEKAGALYGKAVAEMQACLSEMAAMKARRQPITAQKVWELGDAIFSLSHRLAQASLELDDLYGHLTRDLGVKRMWLKKVIIFRRYITRKELLPAASQWQQFYAAPRKAARDFLASQGIDGVSQ